MRPIAFRAWHIKRKVMLVVYNLAFTDEFNELLAYSSIQVRLDGSWKWIEEDEFILMQFTGLKDKKRTEEFPEGQEIYEGDIIDVSMSFEGGTLPHIGKVVYDEGFGSFGTENQAGVTLLHNHCLHTAEIIGTIHDNPELMKGEK